MKDRQHAVSKEDATAPAKVLAEFAKKADKLELKGGVVEGTYYDAAGIGVIATIPSREVLLGKLLGSMQSPITNFAHVLSNRSQRRTARVQRSSGRGLILIPVLQAETRIA